MAARGRKGHIVNKEAKIKKKEAAAKIKQTFQKSCKAKKPWDDIF